MYMVRFVYPEMLNVAYKIFKTFEEAKAFSLTVDLVEIAKVDHE